MIKRAATALTLFFLLFGIQTAHAALANITPIQLQGGNKAIADFSVGDLVNVFSVDSKGVTQGTAQVSFSSGTGPQSSMMAFYVELANESTLIMDEDQPVLLDNGKLTQARRLVPGNNLFATSGPGIQIVSINRGLYRGGIHVIAAGANYSGSMQNHLISSQGVLLGDYWVQIHFNTLHGGSAERSVQTVQNNPYFREYER